MARARRESALAKQAKRAGMKRPEYLLRRSDAIKAVARQQRWTTAELEAALTVIQEVADQVYGKDDPPDPDDQLEDDSTKGALKRAPFSFHAESNQCERPQVVCAWCGSVKREGALPATHGICDECAENEFGSIFTRSAGSSSSAQLALS